MLVVLPPDLQAALRVLCAANRQWETGWKWVRPVVDDLSRKPDQLLERIDAALREADPRSQVHASLSIVLECLAFAPSLPEVERAQRLLREALETGGCADL